MKVSALALAAYLYTTLHLPVATGFSVGISPHHQSALLQQIALNLSKENDGEAGIPIPKRSRIEGNRQAEDV